jgi:hypothetical protein
MEDSEEDEESKKNSDLNAVEALQQSGREGIREEDVEEEEDQESSNAIGHMRKEMPNTLHQ